MGIFLLSLLYDTVNGAYGCACVHRYTQTRFLKHTNTTGSFPSIYGLEMGVVLCLVELSNTILSHIGLTSNTSDKPILFLSTESSPCPKITLLSLGTQQRRMVSRNVDSSLWHLQYAWKANKAIWQELISCHFKNILNVCGMPFGFIFYLKPLTAKWMSVALQRTVNTEAGNSSVLPPRFIICGTQDHIITFLLWQAVSSSSMVSSSVTWRRASRQWCDCNKTCGQHHCQG